MTAYSATKAMQLSLAKSLANLTKGTAVTVNTISPGSTKTEGVETMLQKMFPGLSPEAADKEYIQKNRPTILHERFIRPEEVADAVAFVCSEKAASINGAVLRVDAGTVHHII
jgi:3-oxoacyl-[acyl-carrier protein] reductase